MTIEPRCRPVNDAFEIDHVFVAVTRGAPEMQPLSARGFVEGPSNVHPGQGTACRRIFFENAYLELIWLEDRIEALAPVIARTGLAERVGGEAGASRLGIALRPRAGRDADPPITTWQYTPPYLPDGWSRCVRVMSGEGERIAVELEGGGGGRVDLEASPERVWRALTDAAELERWFPLEAEAEPGEGGYIRLSWEPGQGQRCRIEVWDPPHRLRTTWPVGEGAALVTDYYLERRGIGTHLRVVTSGFPAESGWDDLVEGTRLGWRFELGQLKHYLERHSGEERRVVFVRRRVGLSRQEAWDAVTGDGGLDVGLEIAAAIDRSPPWQRAAVTARPPGGLLRMTVDPAFEGPDARDVSVWLSVWGEGPEEGEELDALERRWVAELERLFPEGETKMARRR